MPDHVEKEFRSYLECGILAHGFAGARCSSCGHDFLVAFSFSEAEYCSSASDSVSPPVGKRHSFCGLDVTGIGHLSRRARCPIDAHLSSSKPMSQQEMDQIILLAAAARWGIAL